MGDVFRTSQEKIACMQIAAQLTTAFCVREGSHTRGEDEQINYVFGVYEKLHKKLDERYAATQSLGCPYPVAFTGD